MIQRCLSDQSRMATCHKLITKALYNIFTTQINKFSKVPGSPTPFPTSKWQAPTSSVFLSIKQETMDLPILQAIILQSTLINIKYTGLFWWGHLTMTRSQAFKKPSTLTMAPLLLRSTPKFIDNNKKTYIFESISWLRKSPRFLTLSHNAVPQYVP